METNWIFYTVFDLKDLCFAITYYTAFFWVFVFLKQLGMRGTFSPATDFKGNR